MSDGSTIMSEPPPVVTLETPGSAEEAVERTPEPDLVLEIKALLECMVGLVSLVALEIGSDIEDTIDVFLYEPPVGLGKAVAPPPCAPEAKVFDGLLAPGEVLEAVEKQ